MHEARRGHDQQRAAEGQSGDVLTGSAHQEHHSEGDQGKRGDRPSLAEGVGGGGVQGPADGPGQVAVDAEAGQHADGHEGEADDVVGMPAQELGSSADTSSPLGRGPAGRGLAG